MTATPIVRAVDPAGVERISPPVLGEALISPEAAALTRELMRLVIDTGTGGAARGAGGEAGYSGQAMGKTGTTDRERDLWFIGATPRYAAAVWMGYDQPASLGWAASDLTAPLWGWWVGRLTKPEGPYPEFPEDPKLERRGICRVTGKHSNGSCPLISAPFLPGTQPKGACGIAHPPPEPDEGEPTEGELDEEGKPKKKKHESLWKKRAREAEEKAAEEAGGQPTPEPPPTPSEPPATTPPA
jgi:penicillin-binding protein 1A